MFVGIQNGKIFAVKNTREELENIPLVEFDEIKETDENYVLNEKGEYTIDGKVSYTAEELRAERDSLLEQTDKYMISDFPITDEERTQYKVYRQYLRDLPASWDFPNVEIMTFEKYVESITQGE